MPKVFSREMWLMCSTDVIKHFIFSVYAYKKEDFSYSIKCTKYNSYAKLLSQKKKKKANLMRCTNFCVWYFQITIVYQSKELLLFSN